MAPPAGRSPPPRAGHSDAVSSPSRPLRAPGALRTIESVRTILTRHVPHSRTAIAAIRDTLRILWCARGKDAMPCRRLHPLESPWRRARQRERPRDEVRPARWPLRRAPRTRTPCCRPSPRCSTSGCPGSGGSRARAGRSPASRSSRRRRYCRWTRRPRAPGCCTCSSGPTSRTARRRPTATATNSCSAYAAPCPHTWRRRGSVRWRTVRSPAARCTRGSTTHASPAFCWNDSVTLGHSDRCASSGRRRSSRGSPPVSWTPSSPTPHWSTATPTS